MKNMADTWRHARDRALRSLDVDGFRALLVQGGAESAADAADEVLLVAIHKARYASTSIEPRLRLESARWLKGKGQFGHRGAAVESGAALPGGEH